MRNPERIKLAMELLTEIWEAQPNIRFNQLLYNLQLDFVAEKAKKDCNGEPTQYISAMYQKEIFGENILFSKSNEIDLFYLEDDDWIEFLKEEVVRCIMDQN